MKDLWTFKADTRLPDNATMAWLYKSYVLGCPVPEVSVCGTSFSERGIVGRFSFSMLKREMVKQSEVTNAYWKAVSNFDSLDETMNDLGIEECVRKGREFAVFYKRDKGSVGGLFYLIRNALSHGSFKVKRIGSKQFLLMETARKGKLTGRAFLSIETLRVWCRVLEEFRPSK